MEQVANEQQKKVHPHKFTMWVAMGSIVMMFAGLTSAYIVKRNQANWQGFELPKVFWYSTAVILLSSVTMYLANRAIKNRQMAQYRQLIVATAVLGTAFIILQFIGFNDLQTRGIKLVGLGSNVAASFLGVIAGVHMVHVLGGIVALLVIVIKAFAGTKKTYSSVPAEVAGTYWHFVDLLWIYLFVFLHWIQ